MQLREETLGGLLEYWTAVQPDHDFMVYPDRGLGLTYAEFNERVNRLALGFSEIGVTRGSKVGVWAKNVPDWLTIFFATAKLGATLVTINTNYRSIELEYLIRNADIHTICMMHGYRNTCYTDIMYELVPELKHSDRGELRSEKFPELRNAVYIGQEKYRGFYNMSELINMGAYSEREQVLDLARELNTCQDEVNMQYTSGTTGFPKGVVLTHHNIINCGQATGDFMSMTPADRVVTCVPMFHCFGCVLALCAVITHGSTMIMVEDFEALRVLEAVHKERATILHGVPTMFIAELNHPRFGEFDYSSLRTGIMAGAVCPVETMVQVNEKMNCKLISVYGLTETSPGMTASRLEDTAQIRATTVGRDYPGVEVRVIDPETGLECPTGVHGEMCCRGYNVMKGYYKNPEATAAVIDSEGFLHSGDLGVRDENGNYSITGRIKDMIIRGGENIYPKEVENFLFTMPQVQGVEVVGLPSPKYGEQVAAFITLKEGQTLTEEQIREYSRTRIAHYKVPRYIFFVNDFPMTASGKIQKYRLREMGAEIVRDRGESLI